MAERVDLFREKITAIGSGCHGKNAATKKAKRQKGGLVGFPRKAKTLMVDSGFETRRLKTALRDSRLNWISH